MAISENQVREIAELARLELTDEQVERFAGQLGAVIEYIDRLKELDVEGVEPMAHAVELTNVLREDAARDGQGVDATLANAPSVKVSIELPHYILDRSVDLPVKVVVFSGPTGGAPVQVSGGQVAVRRANVTTAPVDLMLESQQGSVDTFTAVIAATALSQFQDADIQVLARLNLSDGQQSVAVAMARLYQSTASLEGVGVAYVDGADLVIPAQFNVTDPGFYRVEANLLTKSGAPVSHLDATFMLSAGAATGLMKVHSEVLREKAAAGPYLLSGIDIKRMPAKPGDATRYGSSARPAYPVPGFPLDAYSDEPYVHPAAQQRLEFLQRLSSSVVN